jgi:hypothetical protein
MAVAMVNIGILRSICRNLEGRYVATTMQYVLFYSNHCEHSRSLLGTLSKMAVAEHTSFVCIDSRSMRDGTTYARLQDGKEVPLPAVLSDVPALLMLEKGNSLIVGDDIRKHLDREHGTVATHDDPDAFSWNEMSGLSDAFSYLDTSVDDMLATGSGGNRIMHSFTALTGGGAITTPVQSDDTVPKLASVDMDAYMQQRMAEVPQPVARE